MRKLLALAASLAFVAVASAEQVSLKIEGMVCEAGCVSAVNKALTKVKGVTDKKVEIGKADVTFDGAKTSKKDIVAAIEKAGYVVAK
jgi:copper chaperone CopZ